MKKERDRGGELCGGRGEEEWIIVWRCMCV